MYLKNQHFISLYIGVLLKTCSFFYELEDIFGRRVSECPITEDTMTDDIVYLEDIIENEPPIVFEVSGRSPTPECVQVQETSDSTAEISFVAGTSRSFPGPAINDNAVEISCAAGTSRKGIYSRTGVSEIMAVQAKVISFKKQKLEADVAATDRELCIRESELRLKEKEFELKQNQLLIEQGFKEKELVSLEKLKILELEMKERLAMEEFKLKYK